MSEPANPSPATQGTAFGSTGFGAAPTGGSVDDVITLPVGSRVAEFVITGLIGIGGFGIVYKAHDESLDRIVALKEYMPSSLAFRQQGQTVSVKSSRHAETFQAGLKSFVNEARMLALFDHPALVKVYRFWEANGTAYMVMPLFEGQTLKNALAGQPARPPQAWLMQLLSPLLDALQLLHAKNCFHRDIAPDNIFLQHNGQPVLLDFGAARQVIGDMANNLTVILKPGYAPIEQYASDPNLPQGPWTDLYALAAVLYHAITGKPPSAAVGRLLNDSITPLAGNSAYHAYDPSFLKAIDRALAVKQAERPQSVAEFKQLLGLQAASPITGIYTPTPTATTPSNPTASSQPPNPATSSRSVLLFAVLAGIALLAMGAYFALGKKSNSDESATARSQAPATVAAPPSVSAVLPRATPTPAPSVQMSTPVPSVPASARSQLASASAIAPTVMAQSPTSAPPANKPKPLVVPATTTVEERQSVTKIVHPAPAAAPSPTPAPAAPASTPVKPTPETMQKTAIEKPDWLTDLRKRLASCEEKNLLERVFCVERARRKLCEPDHWGTVEECKVSNKPINEGRW